MDVDWYTQHGCTHAHCPFGCDKPQPDMLGDDLVCSRCLVLDGVVSIMIPCTPETCD